MFRGKQCGYVLNVTVQQLHNNKQILSVKIYRLSKYGRSEY